MPYRDGRRSSSPLLLALGVVGSDVENFECPRCGAHDRVRHLILYLEATGLEHRFAGARVLHFAPETALVKRIAGLAPTEYVLADLHPTHIEIAAIDIEAIPYPDKHFDFVIANHVLEHVGDDITALREIYRVLKPGGAAILQTPYCASLAVTWSDSAIQSPGARWIAYGQDDHVRLYAQDVFDRISSVGLESCVLTHFSVLRNIDPTIAGVNALEPFFLFRRPEVRPPKAHSSVNP